ncbi:SURF1 family protein [Paracoccus sp. DMF-8]|uniref:SURF1 family protein n=1 Tax=Paracoccus sp. DMF-8 TaxID=3019445 RepID=UPI0023E77FFA|nr:SURF1 family protein [Paracoccus sp. DMF-8]MDF3606510.1 SURF1 family protein [Paracoccus sp. DMF-8]
MQRYLFPIITGILGCAILLSLGVWQVQRLGWKENMLAEIQARIDGAAITLPASYQPQMKYQPVEIAGRTTGQEILVLSGTRDLGGGYQVISGFETDDGRRIMVDRGFIQQDDRHKPRPATDLRITGNLHWPEEKSGSTPEPNLTEGIWFAREVPRMASQLGTEDMLVVAREVQGDDQGVMPIPISIQGVPNRHLEYAATWFMLAVIWAGMTVALIWRIRQRKF